MKSWYCVSCGRLERFIPEQDAPVCSVCGKPLEDDSTVAKGMENRRLHGLLSRLVPPQLPGALDAKESEGIQTVIAMATDALMGKITVNHFWRTLESLVQSRLSPVKEMNFAGLCIQCGRTWAQGQSVPDECDQCGAKMKG